MMRLGHLEHWIPHACEFHKVQYARHLRMRFVVNALAFAISEKNLKHIKTSNCINDKTNSLEACKLDLSV